MAHLDLVPKRDVSSFRKLAIGSWQTAYDPTVYGTMSIRMEKAKKLLLREEKMYVKDVAEKVGYKDQFYFSRIFYSYTGVRPSEYVEKENLEII